MNRGTNVNRPGCENGGPLESAPETAANPPKKARQPIVNIQMGQTEVNEEDGTKSMVAEGATYSMEA